MMRMNSSKQHQAPLDDRPLKNVPIIVYSISGMQLNKFLSLARFLVRSIVVSILPMPAVLDGYPPSSSLISPIRLI